MFVRSVPWWRGCCIVPRKQDVRMHGLLGVAACKCARRVWVSRSSAAADVCAACGNDRQDLLCSGVEQPPFVQQPHNSLHSTSHT